MLVRRGMRLIAILVAVCCSTAGARQAVSFDSPLKGLAQDREDKEGVAFFEKKIRPVLVERCYECHSAASAKLKGNFLLDTREGMLKGGDQGPSIVPGDPDRSRLIKAIRHADDDIKMPPKKRLPAEQVADFEAWVRRGAPDPRVKAPPKGGVDLVKARQHWAYQPPGNVTPPRSALPHEVDRFISAKLEEKGLALSKEADKRTLLRRVTYDLIGLPPAPEEIEAFVADASPDAYEKAVDRLLASPHYGERWGRHWLDVARYADTKGYVYADREESRFIHSWAYRDWVIRAFNEDLPFDQFLIQQIAADGLNLGEDKRPLAAMGFLTVGRRFINNTHDIIDDRIDTLTRATMALTVSCARCHDHKFDPIPTADYYSLYGVFHGSTEKTAALGAPASPEYQAELKKRQDAFDATLKKKTDTLLDRLRGKAGAYLAATLEVEKFPTEEFYELLGADDIQPFIVRRWHFYLLSLGKQFHPVFGAWHAFAAIPEKDLAARVPPWMAENGARLNPRVAQLFAEPPGSMKEVAQRYGKLLEEIYKKSKGKAEPLADAAEEQLRHVLYGHDSPIATPQGAFNEIEWFFEEGTRVELGKLLTKIEQWIITYEGSPPQASYLEDRPLQQNPRVFRRGNPANKGEEVSRRTLYALAGENREPFKDGSGRLELARAIASPDNPLTARVWVNRVWHHHFGVAIVGTPSDFGLRSDPPSHPELLDWLARRFIADGWSTKKLHKLLLLSATYRQSSDDGAAARVIDPENKLYWRAHRRRLDYESMRDSMLAAAGRLDVSLGGKPVKLTSNPSPRRRSVYGFIDRLNIPPVFRAFDMAGPDMHSPQRSLTTVPQQALFLMNSPFVAEQARHFSLRTGGKDPEARIQAMYRLLYGRAATDKELSLGRRFVESAVVEPIVHKPTAWKYGYGEIDEATQRVKKFTALPHFTGTAWQGGPGLPDPVTGWVYLNAQGGHAGDDLKRAAIRRWTAPRDGSLTISGTVSHKQTEGDGVRARIVSSSAGELASWTVRKLEAEMKIKGVEVKKGETIDFVVDLGRAGNITWDEFAWAPVIKLTPPAATAGTETAAEWNAATEFTGPPPPPLGPWEKYAQALLLTNEFMFLD